MELELEQTQQGFSHEVFVSTEGVEELKRIRSTHFYWLSHSEIVDIEKVAVHSSLRVPNIKGVNNAKVIALSMFRISPDKVSREAKKVPNTVSASSRTKPITVSQPSVITKKNVNSNLNGLSSTGLDNTKTRRPQPRSNKKNDREADSSLAKHKILELDIECLSKAVVSQDIISILQNASVVDSSDLQTEL
nr:hypothetical protein [Tanacetum cinerariifolium]